MSKEKNTTKCTGNCDIHGGGSSPASWITHCKTCGKKWGPDNPKDDRPDWVRKKRIKEIRKKY
jgi:hypothetical protein